MGSGSYSITNSTIRSSSYSSKSTNEIFNQNSINSAMDPFNVGIRESRDSVEHPNSIAVIIALDVTGSMLSIPTYMVKEGLLKIIEKIIQSGIPDPQVMFLAVGDHVYDRSPLQVSQFESSDELLDFWLTKVWLESGGGGNEGESYGLAHYFAAKHTDIDCFNKRNQKGFLFTIGDEPNLKSYPKDHLSKIFGDGEYRDCTSKELIDEASEKYNVFHIHFTGTRAGSDKETITKWKNLLGEQVLIANNREEISKMISDKIVNLVSTKTNNKIEIDELETISML